MIVLINPNLLWFGDEKKYYPGLFGWINYVSFHQLIMESALKTSIMDYIIY